MRFQHKDMVKIRHNTDIKLGFIKQWISDNEFVFVENGNWESDIWCKTDFWQIETL